MSSPRQKKNIRDGSASFSVPLIILFSVLIALVVWDMRKVQQMSEIIHDDHTSSWEQMNTSSLGKWLTPLDMCMLQVNNPDVDLKQYRSRNCSKLTSIGFATHRLFCNIGSSLGKQCSPPLSSKSRSFFTARLKDAIYGDPSNRYLNQALERLARENKAIIFIGDGISKQNHDAMLCEVMRSESKSTVGLSVGELNTNLSVVQGQVMSNFTLQWRKVNTDDKTNGKASVKILSLSVLFLKMTHIIEPAELERRRKATRRRNARKDLESHGKLDKAKSQQPHKNVSKGSKLGSLDSRSDIGNNISKPNPTERKSRNVSQKNTTSLSTNKNKKIKRITSIIATPTVEIDSNTSSSLKLSTSEVNNLPTAAPTPTTPLFISLDDIKDAVTDISRYHNGLVVVANVGAWYNSREKFRKELPDFMSWLNSLGKNDDNTVFFRETASQHWNHTDIGYFDDAQRYESNGTCVPISDSTPDFDWRNRDVYHFIENNELKEIIMVPFRDITAPLFNMHPTWSTTNPSQSSYNAHHPQQQQQDCTHFCYFPQMWQSMWYHLYTDILVREVEMPVSNTVINTIVERNITNSPTKSIINTPKSLPLKQNSSISSNMSTLRRVAVVKGNTSAASLRRKSPS